MMSNKAMQDQILKSINMLLDIFGDKIMKEENEMENSLN